MQLQPAWSSLGNTTVAQWPADRFTEALRAYAAGSGDPFVNLAAQGALVSAMTPELVAKARTLIGDRATEAGDIASEAWRLLHIALNAGRIRSCSAVAIRAWLHTTVWRLGHRDRNAFDNARIVSYRDEAMLDSEDDSHAPLDELVAAKCDAERVLSGMSSGDRQVILLEAEGHTSEQIGEMTGRSAVSVRKRIERIRGRER